MRAVARHPQSRRPLHVWSPSPRHPSIAPGQWWPSERERMARFELGRLLATPGVLRGAAGDDLMVYLARHARGDWGVVNTADKRANDRALIGGTRRFSAYLLG